MRKEVESFTHERGLYFVMFESLRDIPAIYGEPAFLFFNQGNVPYGEVAAFCRKRGWGGTDIKPLGRKPHEVPVPRSVWILIQIVVVILVVSLIFSMFGRPSP